MTESESVSFSSDFPEQKKGSSYEGEFSGVGNFQLIRWSGHRTELLQFHSCTVSTLPLGLQRLRMALSWLQMDSKEAADFDCPICMQTLHRPIRTQCQHVFCQECHIQNFAMNDGKCPLCRNPTSYMEQPATDIETWMRTMKANCRGCDVEVHLIDMRAHTTTCAQYLREYGPDCNASAIPLLTPASVSATEPNRSTFTCPYCHQSGYDSGDLVQHCCTYHNGDYRHVVCPICASMPWGDSNYYSRNFIQHLRVRHRFQYQFFVNFDQDEELMLQDTIWNSYK